MGRIKGLRCYSVFKMAKSKPSEKVEGWTEARYWSFIRSALRSAWRRYPVKWEVLKEASRSVTGQRHKTEYQCNECKQWFKGAEVQVDHVTPAGQLTDYKHLPSFVEGLYCGKENLQVLCSECHGEKSKKERSDGAYKRKENLLQHDE